MLKFTFDYVSELHDLLLIKSVVYVAVVDKVVIVMLLLVVILLGVTS